jgi:hypothetical protein
MKEQEEEQLLRVGKMGFAKRQQNDESLGNSEMRTKCANSCQSHIQENVKVVNFVKLRHFDLSLAMRTHFSNFKEKGNKICLKEHTFQTCVAPEIQESKGCYQRSGYQPKMGNSLI